MGVLQNVIREIGDIVNRLSVSSKEKQKIQEEIQSLVYRYKSELVREQSAAVGEEARGNWLQRSWRPIVMLAFALVILSGMFMESTLLSDSSRLWDLLEIGLGGYVIGRSGEKGLLMGADVVIATPGRLLSHIANSGIDLSQVSYFILDEADRMLDMGFFDDIMQIVKQMPTKRQTILFSATLPPKIRQLAKQILKDPAEINIAISKPNEAIIQSAYICYETQKMTIIQELFSKPNRKKTIIFSSSKQKVKDLAYSLKRMKLNVAAMHSDLEQEQREAVMLDFKNGKTDILVATDIVARGIDIDDIGLVINYDVPHDPEDYIHRIGRTARANADGVAITFVCEPEQGKFHKIEEFIEKDIYKIPLPPTVGPGPAYNPQAFERRPRGKFKNNRPGRKRPYTRKKNFNKPEN